MRTALLSFVLLAMLPGSASADCLASTGTGRSSCDLEIRIASAQYGSADQWCSGFARVAQACNGRRRCSISLPDLDTENLEAAARTEMRRSLICGPVSAAPKSLTIGWYCSDGETFLGQPDVALEDGGRAILSCLR